MKSLDNQIYLPALNFQTELSQGVIEERCCFLLLLVIEEHALAGLVEQGTYTDNTLTADTASSNTLLCQTATEHRFSLNFKCHKRERSITASSTHARTLAHMRPQPALSHMRRSPLTKQRWQSQQQCSAGQVTALSHIPINFSSCAFSVSARIFPFGLCKNSLCN